jgi:hypothetical protein
MSLVVAELYSLLCSGWLYELHVDGTHFTILVGIIFGLYCTSLMNLFVTALGFVFIYNEIKQHIVVCGILFIKCSFNMGLLLLA